MGVIYNCIFLITRDVEHLFMCILPICIYIFFREWKQIISHYIVRFYPDSVVWQNIIWTDLRLYIYTRTHIYVYVYIYIYILCCVSCSVVSDSLWPHGLSMKSSRQEYGSGLSFLSSRDLPGPGIKLGSPASQTVSLPSELPGKPNIFFSYPI